MFIFAEPAAVVAAGDFIFSPVVFDSKFKFTLRGRLVLALRIVIVVNLKYAR